METLESLPRKGSAGPSRHRAGGLWMLVVALLFGGLLGYSLGVKQRVSREERWKGCAGRGGVRRVVQAPSPRRLGEKRKAVQAVKSAGVVVDSWPRLLGFLPVLAQRTPTIVYAQGWAKKKVAGPFLRASFPEGMRRLKFMEDRLVQSLHPFLARERSARRLLPCLFERLIGWDQRGNPAPELARSWSFSADQRNLTLQLREGVRWHDGREFTSKDVAFTLGLLARYPDAPLTRRLLANTRRVVLRGALELHFEFVRPVKAPWRWMRFYILPQHKFPKGDVSEQRRFGRAPVGTGAFRLHSWRKPGLIWLARFLKHWRSPEDAQKGDLVGKILSQVVPDREVQAGVLHFGGTHGMLDLLPHEERVVLRATKVQLIGRGVQRSWFLALNHGGLLREKALRHALFYALERETWRAHFMKKGRVVDVPFGQQERGGMMLSAGAAFAKAHRLLDAAGWKMTQTGYRDRMPSLLSLRMVLSKKWLDLKGLIHLIASRFEKLGVRIFVSWLEHEEWEKQVLREKDFDITLETAFFGEQRALIDGLHSKGRLRWLGRERSRLDRALEKLHKTSSQEGTLANQKKIGRLFREERPFLLLWQTPNSVVFRQGLQVKSVGSLELLQFVDRWRFR